MTKWRCLHATISLSTGLKGLSHHDALLYTWLIAHGDGWGLVERDGVKGLVFPYRSTERQVEEGLDRLIARGKLCQHEQGRRRWLHLCGWEEFQGEIVRKGRGRLRFPFTCPNDGERRDEAEESATQRCIAEESAAYQVSDSVAADANNHRGKKRGEALHRGLPYRTVLLPDQTTTGEPVSS